MASCKNKQQVGGGETSKILKTKTSNDRVFLPNLYIYMVCAGSNCYWGEVWETKKFLCFRLLACLTQRSCQAFFAASGHVTLKSLGHVFVKFGGNHRFKWDGTLGTVCAGFEFIGLRPKVSNLKAQRICHNNREGCWFKTQKVWGKFQHKVVLLVKRQTNSKHFFVSRLNT